MKRSRPVLSQRSARWPSLLGLSANGRCRTHTATLRVTATARCGALIQVATAGGSVRFPARGGAQASLDGDKNFAVTRAVCSGSLN